MASVCRDPRGCKRILFVGPDRRRRTIRLGRMSVKQSESFKSNLEALINSRITGSLDADTARWISGLPSDIHGKLVAAGLVLEREPTTPKQKFTVGQWVDKYITSRPDVKPITRGKWQNAANKLSAFFKEQSIDTITVQQAKEYRVYLKSNLGLEKNTYRRLVGLARQFFNAAINSKIIDENPFRGQSVKVNANPARFYFVKQETALKVLAECHDAQWRLIFALARWGGMRCPSEILRLKWQDVDFEHSRFVVHASKTEHHDDGGIRTVPMFPELKPLFQDAFDEAKDGDVYCITRYRSGSVNLRTRLEKIIRRAGLEPWPKLFQNLRSTRETELFKMTGGNVKAVCTWIGNSPKVALEHYAQITEADMQEAATMSLLDEAAQKAAQYEAAPSGTVRNVTIENEPENAVFPLVTAGCDSVQHQNLPPRGVEPLLPG